jgi:hypothetical protein
VRCIRSELACSYEQKITRNKRIAILRGREPDPVTQNTSLMETGASDVRPNDEATSPQQISHFATFASEDVSPPHSSVVDRSFELYRTVSGQTYFSRPADTPPLIAPAIALSEDSAWPAAISHNDIIRWIDVYFERLYLTLPVVNRTTLYRDLMLGRHKEDIDFSSMILSMCALYSLYFARSMSSCLHGVS